MLSVEGWKDGSRTTWCWRTSLGMGVSHQPYLHGWTPASWLHSQLKQTVPKGMSVSVHPIKDAGVETWLSRARSGLVNLFLLHSWKGHILYPEVTVSTDLSEACQPWNPSVCTWPSTWRTSRPFRSLMFIYLQFFSLSVLLWLSYWFSLKQVSHFGEAFQALSSSK